MTIEECSEIEREADEWNNSPLRLAVSNLITTLVFYCDKAPLNSTERSKRLAESLFALGEVQFELIGELEEINLGKESELNF
jgi:hypothetical protein